MSRPLAPRSTRSSGPAPVLADAPAKPRPKPRPKKKLQPVAEAEADTDADADADADPDPDPDPAAARTPTTPEAEDANTSGHVAGTPPHRGPLAPPRTPSRREGSRNPSLTPPPSSQPRNTTPTRMPHTQAAHQLFDDPFFDDGEGENDPDFDKQRKKSTDHDDDHDHDHDHDHDQEEDEDESIYPHKAGRIPNEAKELAHAYQKEYFEKMEALATKYGKPVKHFYILVGDVLPPGRREVSEWGVFQSWYNSFGEKRKPAN
ncbi:hypothetical protein H0H93_007696, partial [Arthromyces matolae]